ncbi:MAG TPA: hypothetical protein VGP63_25335 [Planctomycetaceae bacterium]|jgi:hypothetical protein|nr:hypothetical protein [Planctomycetaceae bacterium]
MPPRRVRKAMIEISGTRPENLPAAEPISKVKKTLKDTSRNLKKIDDRPLKQPSSPVPR